MWLIKQILQYIFFPPGLCLVLLFAGLLLWRRRVGVAMVIAGSVIFALSTTPLVTVLLNRPLELYPALAPEQVSASQAQAILVLAGGSIAAAPEYGPGQALNIGSDVRVRYGAFLHRLTGLPIMVTGGTVDTEGVALAQMMADALRREYGISQVWLEERSLSTQDHGKFCPPLLAEKGVSTVYLVTHGNHMRRAVNVFSQTDLHVIPAPTDFSGRYIDLTKPRNWLPGRESTDALVAALHEWIGLIYYALRY